MSNLIPTIKYLQKYYWTAKKPVQINNMFLAEDWNQFDVISTCVDMVSNLSSVLTTVFETNTIPKYLTTRTNELIPSASYLSTVNGLSEASMSGIATIKINDEYLFSSFLCSYLPVGTQIVNTLNGKTLGLSTVLFGISVNNGPISTDISVNLGNYFKQNLYFVQRINGDLAGDQWVITSLIINNNTYNTINDLFYILMDDKFGNGLFKKNEYLPSANVATTDKENSIVNVEMYKNIHKVSATIVRGANGPFTNVVDWICITDLNYSIIMPSSCTLINGTLNIGSPSAGVIYYISKIPL